ncbi:hypothetical protein VTI28DRAFT_3982 [Corynascus sepedonium]
MPWTILDPAVIGCCFCRTAFASSCVFQKPTNAARQLQPWAAHLPVRQKAAWNMGRRKSGNTCLHETLMRSQGIFLHCRLARPVSIRPFFVFVLRDPARNTGRNSTLLKAASAAEPFAAVCHLAAGIQHHRYHQSRSVVTSIKRKAQPNLGSLLGPGAQDPQPRATDRLPGHSSLSA